MSLVREQRRVRRPDERLGDPFFAQHDGGFEIVTELLANGEGLGPRKVGAGAGAVDFSWARERLGRGRRRSRGRRDDDMMPSL